MSKSITITSIRLFSSFNMKALHPLLIFGEGKHGAHITVMTPEETLYYALGDMKECGRLIKFKPKTCQIVSPEAWGPGEQACLVTVEAPTLHQIREKYKIPKNKYEFHITVGVRHKN
jgi:hypothetical protein